MKKIMFNDKYGLTKAVLEGRKTMTRRIISEMIGREYKKPPLVEEDSQDGSFLVFKDAYDFEPVILYPKYKVGEVVAVAQAYKDAGFPPSYIIDEFHPNIEYEAGWSNKMFVRADLMPHQIRITNVRVERLQDISDEDCIREGVQREGYGYYIRGKSDIIGLSAKSVFEILINKISGKEIFESNPWVFVYEFELV